MKFIHDDFLLQTEAARTLFHEFAKDEPIYDYHCHAVPSDVAGNRRFNNLFEIWLEGDHYKWRAMRANGIEEPYCTGEADPWEKFLAYAETVPHTLRNPLYHWSHLELKRYFGIDTLLSGETAKEIWEEANRQLQENDELDAHGILRKYDVRVVGTTDDPTDSLEHHEAFNGSGHPCRMFPTFRPDKALRVDDPVFWKAWIDTLAERSGVDCGTLSGFLDALKSRHDHFHEQGARLSDHGLERCYFAETTEDAVADIFAKAVAGEAASPEEHEAFAFHVMREVGRWNADRGWTMQFHVGAMRNNNTRLFKQLGPDTGFDSIGDYPQAQKMSRFLDSLDETGELPKVVLYNNNPNDNYILATMAGNFQDGSTAGKMQFGSGWWHLDQQEAMVWQMNALSNTGLLSRWVGMLTDSRSFMSYPRHEYFRRVLCNLIGRDLERGILPDDMQLVGGMVKRICFQNAREFFGQI